ncbi:hypothetical protein PanWU01x14_108170 [Parasponia andersonii]|uniref:Uncharacterized protein n=1 Tax=Parasponia andersonii TaxID=3476 RepID=A0A2P5D0G3_PARAD|nr:hypothetical protein PanWU01x14_108170 [Parasponia andersonii]
MISSSKLRLQGGKKRKDPSAPVIGRWCCGGGRRRWVGKVSNGVNGELEEEDKRFVEALREAQPYIFAHMDRTFVVVLSAEIVAGPWLDTILKVPNPNLFFLSSLY